MATPVHAPTTAKAVPVIPDPGGRLDHFSVESNVAYAGKHLIADFWEASHLDDKDFIERALTNAVKAGGATLLHIYLHVFTPSGGVSGVAVLAESHISVHTWPERGLAAFDVFMCGDSDPNAALEALKRSFTPKRIVIGLHKRGMR